MLNMPKINLGIAFVSSVNFDPKELAILKDKLLSELFINNINATEFKTLITTEIDALKALSEIQGINALVILLCDFCNELAVTTLVKNFDGPAMIIGLRDENIARISHNSRDNLAAILSINYNLSLREIKAHIPDLPVTSLRGVINNIIDFNSVSSIYLGIKKLKLFSFGTRSCEFSYSPNKLLFDLGIEIQESGEVELIKSYLNHLEDPRIGDVSSEIIDELDGYDNLELVKKFAAYELTLIDWYLSRRGACKYAAFSIKCSTSFINELGFSPCYVHSRLSDKGIPVSCNNDIFGAISNYIAQCACKRPVGLFSINNNIPKDIFLKLDNVHKINNLFIGIQNGSTPISLLKSYTLTYNHEFNKLIGQDKDKSLTLGVLEGNLKPSVITLLRLMPNQDNKLHAYVVEGEVLDYNLPPKGGRGIFAIEKMAKFYKEVLIDKVFNQHISVAPATAKKAITNALKLLNIENIYTNN